MMLTVMKHCLVLLLLLMYYLFVVVEVVVDTLPALDTQLVVDTSY